MKAIRVMFHPGLLIGFGLAMPGMPTAAQTTPPKDAQPAAPRACGSHNSASRGGL